MKCKACETVLTGRQREFCSDKCRKRASRTGPGPEDVLQSTNADKMAVEPGQSERGQVSRTSVTDVSCPRPYVTVDGKCYNRQAVACYEFGTRPAPVDLTDQPVPMNRGRYKRVDGTVYQFDCQGKHFECKYPFKDRYGKPHLAVYETVADVRQAASPAPVHGQGASQA